MPIDDSRTRRVRQRGSQTIEFAVAALAFLAFLFGVIDSARALYAYEFLTWAARAGARYAMVRGNQCTLINPSTWCNPSGGSTTGATNSDIQSYVQRQNLPGINPSALVVTASWPGTGTGCNSNSPHSPNCPVLVIVQFPYQSSIPFLRVTTFNLTAASEMVISQ